MSDTPKQHGFYIPEPKNRPGDSPDFGDMEILKFAPVAKPDISETSENLRHLPFQLVRTLTDDDIEDGHWKPKLSAAVYRKALRYMSITRIFDEKLLRMQRHCCWFRAHTIAIRSEQRPARTVRSGVTDARCTCTLPFSQ